MDAIHEINFYNNFRLNITDTKRPRPSGRAITE
jgi:hypothetical protein